MKTLFTFIAFCLFSIAASAQMNTDSSQTSQVKLSSYESRNSKISDHLHPKFPNLANPSGSGFEMDGTVYKSEAIINRHITNINDLIR